MGATGVLAGLALATICGVLMQGALGRRAERLAVRCAYGWGLGCLAVALTVFVLGLARLPITAGTVALGPLSCAAAAVAGSRRRARLESLPTSTPETGADCADRTNRTDRDDRDASSTRSLRAGPLVLIVLVGLIAAAVIATSLLSMDYKAMFSDVRTVWLLKARVVFHDRGLDGSYWTSWADAHDRRAYPPLVSFVAAWEYLLAGGIDDSLAKLVFGGFLASLLILIHDSLRTRVSAWLAALATLCFALSTQTFLFTSWGVADMPLAYFVLAAVHALSSGARPRPGLSGLLLAGAAFTKLDGIAAVIAVCAAALAIGSPLRSLRVLCALALPAALLSGAWMFFLRRHDIPILLGPGAEASVSAKLVGLRLSVIARQFLTAMMTPGWMATWPLFALALLLVARWKPDTGTRFRMLVVVALALAYATVYAVQAGDIDFLARTTVGRLMYHAFPLAFVVVVVALGERRQSQPAA